MYLYGTLQNSDAVVTANKALTGTARPSGQSHPLGKAAEAAFVEVGYNIQSLVPSWLPRRTDAFIRYDTVDPMKEVAGNVTRETLNQETVWTVGFNYFPRPEIVAKLQYSKIKSGFTLYPEQTEIMAGLGFYYSQEN